MRVAPQGVLWRRVCGLARGAVPRSPPWLSFCTSASPGGRSPILLFQCRGSVSATHSETRAKTRSWLPALPVALSHAGNASEYLFGRGVPVQIHEDIWEDHTFPVRACFEGPPGRSVSSRHHALVCGPLAVFRLELGLGACHQLERGWTAGSPRLVCGRDRNRKCQERHHPLSLGVKGLSESLE